ncbi:hypothetical protein [Streptomyces umbrinus]|uniref:hypothetical protein n=1 Tax=Streptomyces umbrinus TaxID=67370 RepID=UPI0027D8F044|nr:hypothetical protein [Streptomyces umbrinus]
METPAIVSDALERWERHRDSALAAVRRLRLGGATASRTRFVRSRPAVPAPPRVVAGWYPSGATRRSTWG